MGHVQWDNTEAITLVITIPIKQESVTDFVEAASGLVAKVRENEPDTVFFTLNEHPTATDTFVFVETYRNAAALQAHQESEYLATAISRLPEWLAGPPEELRLRQIVSR
jgi:quinol monooxygenase YgiN